MAGNDEGMPPAGRRLGAPLAADRFRVQQLDALTALRFFAALYVLLFHYVLELTGAQTKFTGIGYTGVTFFFVLSGFILAHNYHRTDFTQREHRDRYFAARLSRIYPVFILSLLVSAPFALAQLVKTPPGLLKTLAASSGLLAPLGLHAWLPGASCAINCPSWSISTEFLFYLVFPFLIRPIMRRPGLWGVVTLVAWAVFCGAYLWLWNDVAPGGSIIADQVDVAPTLAAQLIKYFPIGRLPEFMLGIVVYAVWQRYRDRIDVDWASAAFIAAAIVILVAASRIPEVLLHNGATVVVWVPLILAAANTRSGFLVSAPAVYLGRISFALYLFHVPVISIVKALDKRALDGLVAQHPLVALPAVTVLAMAVAALVFHLVEEPLRPRVMQKLSSRWRHMDAMAGA